MAQRPTSSLASEYTVYRFTLFDDGSSIIKFTKTSSSDAWTEIQFSTCSPKSITIYQNTFPFIENLKESAVFRMFIAEHLDELKNAKTIERVEEILKKTQI